MNTAMLGGVGAGRGSSSHLLRAEDAPAPALGRGILPPLASGPNTRRDSSRPPLTGTRTRQAPAGHVAGAMDALGRVTEGQPPRPDPNLAPAYLALMPLRASAVRVRRGAHHAHPQGNTQMDGTF